MRKSLDEKAKAMLEERSAKRRQNAGVFSISVILCFTIVYLTVFPALTMTEKDGAAESAEYELVIEPPDAENFPLAAVEEAPPGTEDDGAEDEGETTQETEEETETEKDENEEELLGEVEEETSSRGSTSPANEETAEEIFTDEQPEVELPMVEVATVNSGLPEEEFEPPDSEESEADEADEEAEEEIDGVMLMATGDTTTYVYQRVTGISSMDDFAGDGNSYLIVNINRGISYVLTDTVSTTGYLDYYNAGTASDYITGAGLTEWSFSTYMNGTRTNRAVTSDSGEYLRINGTSVTTTANRQSISWSVVNNSSYSDQFQLYNRSNNTDYYLNLYGSGSNGYFGGYAAQNDVNAYLALYKKVSVGNVIFYDLNFPTVCADNTSYAVGDDWVTTPTISSTTQELTAGSTLYAKPDGYYDENATGAGSGFYRYAITDGYSFTDDTSATNYLGSDYPYYKEYRFDGWQTTDVNGETCVFDPEAQITLNSDSTFTVTDIDGVERTIAVGSTLSGVWTQVSSPVSFFVNYTGTILDTEGDVAGRSSAYFTGVVAVGTVYLGEHYVGSDGYFATSVNDEISSMFTSLYDLDMENGGTQIVIRNVTVYNEGEQTAYYNVEALNINASNLEEYLLNWIQLDDDLTITLSTGNGETVTIDNTYATAENYGVRWYVLKEQTDGWHVDGVMVAKTTELTVVKNFDGLTDAEAQSVIENGFYITLSLNDKVYMTLTTTSVDGQYTYNGYSNFTASWTVQVLTGEVFTVEEYEYDYGTDTCATIIVVDSDTSTQTIGPKVENIVGGTVGTVGINNAYTNDGNGILAILKTDESGTVALSGAEFTLTDSGGNTTTAQSNSNGIVIFTDLEAGSYVLTETAAPAGYVADSSFSADVTVAVENERVSVSIDSDTTYSYTGESGAVAEIYLYKVANTAEANSMAVEKTFSGSITLAQIQAMTDYSITLSGAGETKTVYLSDADAVSLDGKTYTWSFDSLTEGTVYTVTEANYLNPDYDNTIVTAQFNSADISVTTDSGAAQVSVTKTDQSDTLVINNDYTNDFELQILKLDADTGAALAGAEFKLYGPFSEATNVDDNITVSGKVYYYISTLTTDSNGTATIMELNPSSTYAVVEVTAPENYTASSDPIIIEDAESYLVNGIYTLAVTNQRDPINATVTKSWLGDSADTSGRTDVTIYLYRMTDTETQATFVEAVTLTESGSWSYTWQDLEYCDQDGNVYQYYVYEVPVSGYSVSYTQCVVLTLSGGAQIYACPMQDYAATVFNIQTTVPEAGGGGTIPFTAAGLMLILLSGLLYIKLKNPLKGGSV